MRFQARLAVPGYAALLWAPRSRQKGSAGTPLVCAAPALS